ncbi:4-methyl-5(B-hydroxyethyl)-thiazole monophosphate biosynthesis protein [Clostridium polyendosporum]|uniref:4-methyl-5(B-hydroxyethyl)-thiazole monophosphate biosynthesis protein n=1 Tax=Clostridium polyendosporum TaxID=69208 RepID=A0A919RX82_9CLOT|nr:DJ-1 family glyoxalase III [Clostridium polyendosporum]GIM28137.1 4-methyl-5(B-hydroxyethyl)-thiazole monophosphate biosynthesis protein [Clostridium polyendosporum]
MKRILVMLAEGFEEIEALTVVDVLRRANVECVTCSLKEKEIQGAHNILVTADKSLEDNDLNTYDGIVLPGGMPGSVNLRDNIKVVELVKDYYAAGKLVAAICAAPIVLAKAGIADGKILTSYPSFKDQLDNCIYIEQPVVVDQNIITSRGPATTLLFAFEILKKLGYEEEAKELSEGMLVDYLMNK